MVRYICVAVFLSILLMGCRSESALSNARSNWYHYQNSTIGYSLDVPNEALKSWQEKKPSDAQDSGFATYSVLAIPTTNDYSIVIRQAFANCTPSLTGASHTTDLPNGNGKARWGQADYWGDVGMEGWEPAYDVNHVVCAYDYMQKSIEYAFCSEKNGKTVVICINQVTKNESLAKQIFETFRWSK
jgi:hypothetical protein